MSYSPKVFRRQGGAEYVAASGGKFTIEAGGGLDKQDNLRLSDEDTYQLTVEQGQVGFTYIGTKGSATQVISLPPPTTKGLRFDFVCGHADGEINVNPGAATYKIQGSAIAVAATKDLKNTAATNVLGDSVSLVSDGVDTWWMTAIQGTWATT